MSSQKLNLNPSKYKNKNERKRILGEKHSLVKGELIRFFESDNKRGWVDIDEPNNLSISKIKNILYQTISGVCKYTGNDISNLNLQIIKLPRANKKDNTET